MAPTKCGPDPPLTIFDCRARCRWNRISAFAVCVWGRNQDSFGMAVAWLRFGMQGAQTHTFGGHSATLLDPATRRYREYSWTWVFSAAEIYFRRHGHRIISGSTIVPKSGGEEKKRDRERERGAVGRVWEPNYPVHQALYLEMVKRSRTVPLLLRYCSQVRSLPMIVMSPKLLRNSTNNELLASNPAQIDDAWLPDI